MPQRNVLEAAIIMAATNGGYQYRGLERHNMPIEYWNLPHRSYEEHLLAPDFWQALEAALGWYAGEWKQKAAEYIEKHFAEGPQYADNYLINLMAKAQ